MGIVFVVIVFFGLGLPNILYAQNLVPPTTPQTPTHPSFMEKQLYSVLKKEIESGYALDKMPCPDNCTVVPLDIDKSYMNVEITFLKQYLKKRGISFLPPSAFTAKMKAYFHVDPSRGSRMLYFDCEEAKGLKDLVAFSDFARPVFGLYISKEGLVTYVYRLPYLINYQTHYPKLYHLEKELSRTMYDEHHVAIGSREFWYEAYQDIHGYRENQSIDQVIQANLDTVFKLNRYLLDGDQTQFEWLYKHTTILQDLMPVYGYAGDENLIKHLLKKGHIRDLLWYKGCKHRVDLGEDYTYNGTLEIHTKVFNIIAEKLKNKTFKQPKDTPYLEAICEEIGDIQEERKLTTDEKVHLRKYLQNFMHHYLDDNQTAMTCMKPSR